jgi:Uma2 family endonuclease
MSELAATAVSEPEATSAHDHIVVLRGATWADYQRLLELRGERSSPRLTYLEGALELMSPSRRHESVKSMLGRLIEGWCFERGVDITPYGSWTLEDKAVERGIEPDECYVVGEVDEPRRPHLALEVVWTSGGLDKLAVYGELGIGEVWFWESGRIRLFALRGRAYEPLAASDVLAGLDHDQLAAFVEVTPMTRAVREYRQALRAASPPGTEQDPSAST